MRWMNRISVLAVLAGSTVFAPPAGAGAGQCIVAAKGQYVEAIQACKDTMLEAKDSCLNRDHACVDVCRDSRYQCVSAASIATTRASTYVGTRATSSWST